MILEIFVHATTGAPQMAATAWGGSGFKIVALVVMPIGVVLAQSSGFFYFLAQADLNSRITSYIGAAAVVFFALLTAWQRFDQQRVKSRQVLHEQLLAEQKAEFLLQMELKERADKTNRELLSGQLEDLKRQLDEAAKDAAKVAEESNKNQELMRKSLHDANDKANQHALAAQEHADAAARQTKQARKLSLELAEARRELAETRSLNEQMKAEMEALRLTISEKGGGP